MDKSKRVPASFSAVGCENALDPSIHERLVRPWKLCHTPLEAGSFGYQMEYLLLDGVTLYRERFNLRCRLQGLSPPDTLAFSLPVRLGARSDYWGAPLDASGLPAMLPGGLDMRIDSGQEQWVVLIERRVLNECCSPEFSNSLERAAGSRLLPACTPRLRRLGHWLHHLLRHAQECAENLRYPLACQAMREDLLQRLAETLALDRAQRCAPSPSKRVAGLSRALEVLRQPDPVQLSVPELSRIARVSQRTLEYAFRETLGLTPLAFIRLRRLHAARAALVLCNPGQRTVAHVASNYGFYELGRFAATYRRQFGELPSCTLERSAPALPRRRSPLD